MKTVPVVMLDRFWLRFFGLMGRTKISDDVFYLLKPCNSIHTYFMRCNIDIAFIDGSGRVVGVHHNVAKNKLLYLKHSACVMEGASGSLKQFNIEDGDQLDFITTPYK